MEFSTSLELRPGSKNYNEDPPNESFPNESADTIFGYNFYKIICITVNENHDIAISLLVLEVLSSSGPGPRSGPEGPRTKDKDLGHTNFNFSRVRVRANEQ